MKTIQRLPVAAALLIALVACQGPAARLPFSPPSPESVALQPGDLPNTLRECPGSGPIATYLSSIRSSQPDSYAQVSDAWTTFKQAGADAAAITAFTQDPKACSGALGAGQGQSAASFVIRYRDEASAAAAYRKGILGFPSPDPQQQTAGLTVGEATGLGKNSWVFDRDLGGRAAYIAFWQIKRFDILVFAADLSADDARRAVDSVNRRAR